MGYRKSIHCLWCGGSAALHPGADPELVVARREGGIPGKLFFGCVPLLVIALKPVGILLGIGSREIDTVEVKFNIILIIPKGPLGKLLLEAAMYINISQAYLVQA